MLARYRALGADPPFSDLRRGRGAGMDGYFWRLSDPRHGRVVIALCGVCDDGAGGTWANVALGGHPSGVQHDVDLPRAGADPERLAVWAGRSGPGSDAFAADERSLSVALDSGDRLDVALHDRFEWARPALGGCGPAHLIPGLGQYWHPYLLGARVTGTAVLGGEPVSLDGWTAYAEKNWSPADRGFPPRWWWGQASGFARADVCVAFAGGEVAVGPARLEATGVVVRIGDRVIRLGNPVLAPARLRAGGGRWSLRARGPVWAVALDGSAGDEDRHRLGIPLPARRRSVPAADQHLAGVVELAVRRRGRVVFAGRSSLAGLELGVSDSIG